MCSYDVPYNNVYEGDIQWDSGVHRFSFRIDSLATEYYILFGIASPMTLPKDSRSHGSCYGNNIIHCKKNTL